MHEHNKTENYELIPANKEDVEISFSSLLEFIRGNLVLIRDGTLDKETVAYTLECYNALRNLEDLPEATTLADIDSIWLNEQIEIYEEVIAEDSHNHLEEITDPDEDSEQSESDHDHRLCVIGMIEEALTEQKKNPASDYDKKAITLYNYLRESAYLSHAASINDIDTDWLEALGYTLWKKMVKRPQADAEISADQHKLLLWSLITNILHENDDQNGAKEALYTYNFLRESAGLSTINSLDMLDHHWLNTYGYSIWKKQVITEWHDDGIDELSHKLDLLVDQFEEALITFEQDPEDYIAHQDKQCCFMFYQELIGQPLTEAIDAAWLRKHHYQQWKDRFIRDLVEYNLAEKQLMLIHSLENFLPLVAEEPDQTFFAREALYHYMLLQEFDTTLSPIANIQQLQSKFLKKYGYEIWKSYIEHSFPAEFGMAEINPYELARDAEAALREFDKDPHNKSSESNALYKYNFLRERLSLSPVYSSDDINGSWLANLKKQLKQVPWL